MSNEVPHPLRNVFKYIDENRKRFIAVLREAVEIPSVASLPNRRQDAIYMVYWMAEKMSEYGIKVEVCEVGNQVLPNTVLKFPPFILATLGNDANKKTVLVYSHLDVVSAFKEDGWDTEPFMLIEKGEKLYGRGVSDNKGPAVGWLHAIEAYQKNNIELPVNIKFLYAGLEERGEIVMEEAIKPYEEFFADVDVVCASDCSWLGLSKPCIAYGFRGYCFFHVEIQSSRKDLHSGRYGGVYGDAMNDMLFLLNRLVDADGNILIPGIYDDIEPITLQEEKMYANIDFNVRQYKDRLGCQTLTFDDKISLLMARWRYPCLTIHEIGGGCFSHSDSWQTIIPKKVTGKFSLRIVGNQDPKKIATLVIGYLDSLWAERNSFNKYKVKLGGYGKPWTSSINHDNYRAAWRACKYVYNIDPDMIRIGETTAIVTFLQELIKKNIMMLAMGRSDDNTYATNEKLDVYNYLSGIKLFASYLYELSQ